MFRNKLVDYTVFSTNQIDLLFRNFDSRRLVEWQKKGYIQKIINRWYCFTEIPKDENLLYWVANQIYQPAYISLESALSYHGFIAEGVFTITSVSTNKTQLYQTSIGTFSYRSLKPSLYFGYTITRWHNKPLLIADPEKTILDYLYLNANVQTINDFEALRFNIFAINKKINRSKLDIYLQLFDNKRLNNQIVSLLKYINQ
jgi:predicted transcriptional regulator of viral defense system